MSRDLNASLAAIDAAVVDLPFEAKASAMGPRLAYAGPVMGDMANDAVGDIANCVTNSVTNNVADGAAWQEPRPIQAPLRPVPAFDPHTLLPDALRAWVMDEADRMPCPPDFVAAGALVALGSIIGARCAIKPKSRDPWLIVPNLWGGIVGLPSAKKSPAIGAALKPLDRLIARAMEAYKAESEAFVAIVIRQRRP